MRRVSGDSARLSEPRNISLSPNPTASGAPWRAPIISSLWPAKIIAIAYAPCSRVRQACAASRGDSPRLRLRSTICATVSLSVSVLNTWPSRSSSARSSTWFSMMPLCTIETSAVPCGCALPSVGAPCVAQRVWPMPVVPPSGRRSSTVPRWASLPSARRRSMCPLTRVATPAES